MPVHAYPTPREARLNFNAFLGGWQKQADLTEGEDMPFEQAFSNLAHAYLADRAPGLLDYEAGFQLLDRNDDGDRAVGVLGFKVGSQWLYAPVFFVNGDLKGHELLYVKNQRCFVPLREDWVNYLINKRPLSLGSGVHKDLRQLGVRQPDYARMIRSPGKFASAEQVSDRITDADRSEFRRDAVRWYAHEATANPFRRWKEAAIPTLPELLVAGGEKMAHALAAYVTRYPMIGVYAEELYGDRLQDALAQVRKQAMTQAAIRPSILRGGAFDRLPIRKQSSDPIESGELAEIRYDKRDDGSDLVMPDDGDPIAARSEGGRIRDNRDDSKVTRVTNLRTPRNLRTPGSSGLYEVLVSPGKTVKCMVLIGAMNGGGRTGFATVVEAASPHRWLNADPTKVWVTTEYPDEDWRSWVKSLPTARTAPSREEPDTPSDMGRGLLFLDPDQPDGTLPLWLGAEYPESGEWLIHDVSFADDVANPAPTRITARNNGGTSCRASRIMVGPAGVRFRTDGTTLVIPETFHRLDLAEGFRFSGFSDEKLMPVSGIIDPDLEAAVKVGSSLGDLRIFAEAAGYLINGVSVTKSAAVSHLVFRHGLDQESAQHCLDDAQSRRFHRRDNFGHFKVAYPEWVKASYGDNSPYPAGLVHGGPVSVPFREYGPVTDDVMGSDVPTYRTQRDEDVVPSMMANPDAAQLYRPNTPVRPDPAVAETASRAAESGQREIFETSMLGGMLRSTGPSNLVDQYLPKLTDGMNAAGSLLFNLYAHTEEFEERYGKDSLPELEDTLTDNLNGLGDCILFLRKKTVEANPQEALQETHLRHEE